jgi:hypothetical protein
LVGDKAVSNNGAIGYIVKTSKYKEKMLETYKLMQEACNYFLNNCSKTGLIYEDH